MRTCSSSLFILKKPLIILRLKTGWKENVFEQNVHWLPFNFELFFCYMNFAAFEQQETFLDVSSPCNILLIFQYNLISLVLHIPWWNGLHNSDKDFCCAQNLSPAGFRNTFMLVNGSAFFFLLPNSTPWYGGMCRTDLMLLFVRHFSGWIWTRGAMVTCVQVFRWT